MTKKISIILLCFISGCAMQVDISVQTEAAVLIKKRELWRGESKRVQQWWQLERRKEIILFELLPEGDTGSVIGIRKEYLNRQ